MTTALATVPTALSDAPRAGSPARRLRIAHVVRNLQVGGMEKLLVELARHTRSALFESAVISLQTRGPLADEIEACGVPVHCLDAPDGLQPRLVGQLARLFAELRPDVVHSHNHPAMLYAALGARWSGVPVMIQTRHGQSLGMSLRQRLLVRAASLALDRVVCVSADAAALTAQEGIPRRQITRIWNGIDLSQFGYEGPQVGGPVVMVARLSPIKDTETLVRAAGLLRAQIPSLRIEIAGDGECRVPCQQLTEQLGLREHVHFLGTVRDVPALLGRASAFVLPSQSEGISLTILEAMARGLPVITTRVGGNPEVVRDGETGFLVPPGSPAALAERIGQLWLSPALGRSMGQAGRQRVETHFDSQRMARNYEQLYLELVQQRSA